MNYCAECGAKLSGGAKFCHDCGRALEGSPTAPKQNRWVWIAGGWGAIVLVAGVTVAVMQSNGGDTAGTRAPPSSTGTDVLSLPPREQADRLFDRVMGLSEQGDSTQAAFFIPMAVQAHQMLDVMDADARFHIGELELLRDGTAAALAQADSIAAVVPNHLFVYLLRGKAAEQASDAAAVAEAYAGFLANQEAQLALNRREYQQHRFVVSQFAERARGEQGAR